MPISQQRCERKWISRATAHQRIIGAVVFAVVALSFGVLWLFGSGRIDPNRVLPPCGFQQRFELPCLTCGFTTSGMAFAQGRIAEAYYVQPAAGLMYTVLAAAGFFALLTACLGIYWRFIFQFWRRVHKGYVVLAVLVVLAGGWAVTLALALAARNQV